MRSISRKAKVGDRLLSTRSFRVPDPDLMNRTESCQRVGNLLLWQISRMHRYVYGPDFREPHLIDGLHWFQQCDLANNVHLHVRV